MSPFLETHEPLNRTFWLTKGFKSLFCEIHTLVVNLGHLGLFRQNVLPLQLLRVQEWTLLYRVSLHYVGCQSFPQHITIHGAFFICPEALYVGFGLAGDSLRRLIVLLMICHFQGHLKSLLLFLVLLYRPSAILMFRLLCILLSCYQFKFLGNIFDINDLWERFNHLSIFKDRLIRTIFYLNGFTLWVVTITFRLKSIDGCLDSMLRWLW